MKLFGMLSNDQLLKGLYFLALLSPLAPINAPWSVLLTKPYIGYLLFFIGFLSFVSVIKRKPSFAADRTIPMRLLHYAGLILLGLLMVAGLGFLGGQRDIPLPLYLTLVTCTLHALLYSKRSQDSPYLFATLHLAFVTTLIFTGFEAINFPARYGALCYALGLACSFTAPHLLVRLTSLTRQVDVEVPEVRTRKHRRKFKIATNKLASSTNWRWIMLALLLLGPTILAAASMTNFFPHEFGVIILTLTLAQPLVQPLPVKGPIPPLPNHLLRDWILFSYLLPLCIYLARLIFS